MHIDSILSHPQSHMHGRRPRPVRVHAIAMTIQAYPYRSHKLATTKYIETVKVEFEIHKQMTLYE